MNRKAVFFAIYLVVIASILSGYMLYQFISLRKQFVTDFHTKNMLESIYNERDAFIFYIKASLELSAGQAFQNLASKPNFYISHEGGLKKFNEEISMNELLKEVKVYFSGMFKEHPLYKENKDYELKIENNKIKFELANFKLVKEEGEIDFPYKAEHYEKLVIYLDLEEIGLSSFEKIYEAGKKCNSKETSESKKSCYEKELLNFNFDIKEVELQNINDKINEIVLTTKRKFVLIDNKEKTKIDNIKVEFVP